MSSVGFREIHRLVGAVAAKQLADQHPRLYGVTGDRLRANSLFVGLLMEELAVLSGEDPRSCYTIGLLRSVGKMALEVLARNGEPVLPFAESGEQEVDAWEKRSWGGTNGEVAEMILEHWCLPHETVMAVRHHYHPENCLNPLIHLLNLAAGAAEHRGFGLPGEETFWKFSAASFTQARVDRSRFQAVTDKAHRTFERLVEALG